MSKLRTDNLPDKALVLYIKAQGEAGEISACA